MVLKLIKPNQDADRVAREVLAARQARWPRIPEIMDDGEINGPTGETVVWVRERRIEGQTLRQLLQPGPLPITVALALAIDVLEALDTAE
ncbi:MAG TPA: hypothetical protein VK571_02275, partial [Gemmatimonadaceae bacterium]|nr:hypothetical protein [Gemmatimonadaceae bacterium]